MLFRKDIEPRCGYCAKGSSINEEEVICKRKGVVSADSSCSAFRYDPLKRVPPRPLKLDTHRLSKEDFQI